MLKDSSSKPPTLSRNAMYGRIASRGGELIDKLWLETESKNPSIRIAALRTLLNKVLPDITTQELAGLEGKPIQHEFDDTKLIAAIHDKLKKLGLT